MVNRHRDSRSRSAGRAAGRDTDRAAGLAHPTVRPSCAPHVAAERLMLHGESAVTTVMLKNIPNKFTQKMLHRCLDSKHHGEYDFLYLPIDFKNRCNKGYCFVNFRSPEVCTQFTCAFHGVCLGPSNGSNSAKVCKVVLARFQGLEDSIQRLKQSPVIKE